ncbi:nucleotidyltransferase family protein [Pseudonocardia phyllosphaerae]|uniref:nucleotidyltransferase family protein n=1 Tax=Pseudonocardia phyllosphaerae TaxID=3390502 RepID=UPI00397BBFEA
MRLRDRTGDVAPSLDELRAQRDAVLAIARRHGASRLRVFGSVARGESTPTSDVDLVVDMATGRTLFDLGGLAADLEELFGRPVDVVSSSGLAPRLEKRLDDEAVLL